MLTHIKRRGIYYLLALSIVGLASCAPSVIEIPADYTARTLQVLPAQGEGDATQHGAAFSAARAKAASYPDLFTVVEVANDDQTVLLQISVDTFDRSTYESGNAKYGYTTSYYSTVTTTATLLDPSTGGIISTATKNGSTSSSSGYPGYDAAMRESVQNSIDAVFRSYATSL